MKIVHRIVLPVSAEDSEYLREHGVAVKPGDFEVVKLDAESDAWLALGEWLQNRAVAGISSDAVFSHRELESAEYLSLEPSWHHGYPQPEENFGYLDTTYDCSGGSREFGVGCIQKAPFRLKKEPNWGKRHILKLNWVFDEYFCKLEVWNDIFRPLGIESIPVEKYRTGEVLKTVVQLKPQIEKNNTLMMEGIEYEMVSGYRRYRNPPAGYFPKLAEKPAADYFQTREYFGSDYDSHHSVIVSGKVYRAIVGAGLRGVSFTPLKT